MRFYAQAAAANIGELTAWIAGGEGRADNTFYVSGKLPHGTAVTLAGAFDTDDISAIRALTHALVQAVDALDPAKGGQVRLAVAWPRPTSAIDTCNAGAKAGVDGVRPSLHRSAARPDCTLSDTGELEHRTG